MITKEQIYNRILNDYAIAFGVNVSDLGQNIKSDSAILAASEYRLTLSVESVKKNAWAGTSDAEMLLIVGLGRLGRLPSGAIAGVWDCDTTQIPAQTANIPEGTEFRKGDYSYLSVGITAPGDTIRVRATTAGVEADLAIGNELKSASALPSINDIIIVSAEITTPVDAESIDSYRSDVVDTYLLTPSGGNASDYILWGESVAGIRNIFPYAKDGEAGKVSIYVEGDNPIIPSGALIDNVIDSIKYDGEGVGRAPVAVFPFITTANVVEVQTSQINITLNNGNASQQATVEGLMTSYLLGIRPYIATLNKTRDPELDTVSQTGIIRILADNNIEFTDIVLTVKPLGGAEQTVTTYIVGDANDPTYYGEVPILESVTINV